jgi:hypothetical protein
MLFAVPLPRLLCLSGFSFSSCSASFYLSLLPVLIQSLSNLLVLHYILLHHVLNTPFLFPLTSFACSSISTRLFPESELVHLLSSHPQFVLPLGMYFNCSNNHLKSYLIHDFSLHFFFQSFVCRPPLWPSSQSSCLQIQSSGFHSRRYQIF